MLQRRLKISLLFLSSISFDKKWKKVENFLYLTFLLQNLFFVERTCPCWVSLVPAFSFCVVVCFSFVVISAQNKTICYNFLVNGKRTSNPWCSISDCRPARRGVHQIETSYLLKFRKRSVTNLKNYSTKNNKKFVNT